jgi:hypothetical protein
VAEVVGDPVLSAQIQQIAMWLDCYQIDEDLGLPAPATDPVGHGFYVSINTWPDRYSEKFPSDQPFPLMTVYYRLKGAPGDTGQVGFCNEALSFGLCFCNTNNMHVIEDSHIPVKQIYYVPSSMTPGTLTVLEGPATNPDRPPEQPRAKVYPQLPTQEEVDFTVEIGGAAARPGDTEVPVEVYASADVEYSSIEIPIDFDERYLRLTRGECDLLSGMVLIDNLDEEEGGGPGEGNTTIVSLGLSSRRIALEGEKVHVATLYFDVLPAAAAVASTSFDVVPVVHHFTSTAVEHTPWVGVHYETTMGTTPTVIKEQIAPLTIEAGRVLILPEVVVFVRGDANFDGVVDISDPVTALGFLFLGAREPICLDAADANDDGRMDITDPIATLNSLFQEGRGMPAPYPEAGFDLTPDNLGCY